MGRALHVAAAVFLAAAMGIGTAHAVIILDTTWAEEGGTLEDPAAGFGANIALANEPQFDAAISFTSDGDTFGECTGTWIGNDAHYGYVLTAAHCFATVEKATGYAYRTQGGTVITGKDLVANPNWTGNLDDRTGYDLIIIRLTEPVTDGGPQPLIYAGHKEKGRLLTFTGFGDRGTGTSGDSDAYYDPHGRYEEKAAGQGAIDQVVDAVRPIPGEGVDAGNYLGMVLPKEDGSIPNPYGGATKPATRLAGLLGSGDSGSPAWMQLADGRWVLIGVGSDGSGTAQYGDSSWFVRLSIHQAWVRSVFPEAKFASD